MLVGGLPKASAKERCIYHDGRYVRPVRKSDSSRHDYACTPLSGARGCLRDSDRCSVLALMWPCKAPLMLSSSLDAQSRSRWFSKRCIGTQQRNSWVRGSVASDGDKNYWLEPLRPFSGSAAGLPTPAGVPDFIVRAAQVTMDAYTPLEETEIEPRWKPPRASSRGRRGSLWHDRCFVTGPFGVCTV